MVEKLFYIFIFLNIASQQTFKTEKKSTYLFVYIFIFKYFQPNKHLPFYIQPTNQNDMTGKEKSTVWHRLMRHRRTKTAQNDCPSAPLLSANTIHSGSTVLVGPLNVCNSRTNGAWHRIIRRNSFIPRLSLVLRRSATIVGTTAKEVAKQMEKDETAERRRSIFVMIFQQLTILSVIIEIHILKLSPNLSPTTLNQRQTTDI